MSADEIDDAIGLALAAIGRRSFSTADVIDALRTQNSRAWQEVVAAYGEGGRGSGSPYSAAVYVAQQLDKRNRAGTLVKLDYRAAPLHWGNALIRYWAIDRAMMGGSLYPDEADTDGSHYMDGSAQKVVVNRYERDPRAREACIEHYGLSCQACGMNFEERYGAHGAGFIHVHHVTPLSAIGEAHAIDPTTDLIPLCPNCHAMAHYGPETLTIDELKAIITNAAR